MKQYKSMDSDSELAGESMGSSTSSTPAQSQYNAAAYLSKLLMTDLKKSFKFRFSFDLTFFRLL